MQNAKKLIRQLRRQLALLGVPRSSCGSQYSRVVQTLAACFADKAASLEGGSRYIWLADKSKRLDGKMRVELSTDSDLCRRRASPQLVICYKVVVPGESRVPYMHLVTEVEGDMLPKSVSAKLAWTMGDKFRKAYQAQQAKEANKASARPEFSLAQ
ncbi:hypothetical protein AAVH_21058 [Aphelenchoides avenae]|nr:hypothetical protein AAVH_21058 [Aphelenchus avenae]